MPNGWWFHIPQEPVPGHGRDDNPPGAPRGPVSGTGADGIAARAAGGYAASEQGCSLDGEIASAVMGVVLDELAGPSRSPAGASDDAVAGMIAGANEFVIPRGRERISRSRLQLVRRSVRPSRAR